MSAILTDEVINADFLSNGTFIKQQNSQTLFASPDFIEKSTINPISIAEFKQSLAQLEHHENTVDSNDKMVGTAAVQSIYVRTQLMMLLGRHLIHSGQPAYANEKAQLKTLYGNALDFAKSNDARFGERLNRNQDNSELPTDMIWPEKRMISGQSVLVPIVYLTKDTVKARKVTDHRTEFSKNVSFASMVVRNSNLYLARDTFLNVAGDINLLNSQITGDASLQIIAQGAFNNISSILKTEGDLIIGAHSIRNETIVYRYDLGYQNGSHFGQVTELDSANGDLVLRSAGDISLIGAKANASQGEIKLAADGSVFIGPQQITSGGREKFGNGERSYSELSYLTSSLTAKEAIEIIAGQKIQITGAEIVSDEGHIKLLAGLGIVVQDALTEKRSNAEGKFGKKDVEESVYQTVAIRSLLDAGKGITLETHFGDITLKSSEILSSDGTKVTAKHGAVNLLMTTETDHYSYSAQKEDLFTASMKSKGHNYETGVPNSIVGGLEVEALNGIRVEYEGNPSLSVDAQLDALSQMEGLTWIESLRNHKDVNWEAQQYAFEQWNESNTSLTPAAAALITIAVAVATSGAGSAAATAILGSAAQGSALAAAIAAGTTSLISQAALALANGSVNGDIQGALEQLASDEVVESLAVAMVTAGAMAEIDAAFFNYDDMPLEAQALQAVVHSSVTAGAQSLVAGGKFEDNFVQSLAQNTLNILGEKLANKIGMAKHNGDIGTATQYVAHAAVGCLVGSASAALADGDTSLGCVSGSGGAVIGEAIGSAYADELEGDLKEWIDEQVAEGKTIDKAAVAKQAEIFKHRGVDMARLAAALTAFTLGADVNIAADASYNAAENNAFLLISIIVAAAYTGYVSYLEGGFYEGLQAIGRGDDPLAKAIESSIEAGVELLAEAYPEKTAKTLALLNEAGDLVADGVLIVMETETGKTVSRFWHEIPEADRNALLGTGAIVSMAIPAGTLAKLKVLRKVDSKSTGWLKNRKDPEWNGLTDADRDILLSSPDPIVFSDKLIPGQDLTIDPRNIGFSQNTVSYYKIDGDTKEVKYTFDDILNSMKTEGWNGDPIDVVIMKDGVITSMDNTRVLAARQAGIDVKVNVRGFNSKLTASEKVRFTEKGFPTPENWGQAIQIRLKKQQGAYQKGSFYDTFPNGSIYNPKLKKNDYATKKKKK